MLPKPAGLAPKYGAQFQDASVAAAYHHRPPYPVEVFDVLVRLIADEPRTVLDAGAGAGEIARPLAARVDRVDALDPSRAMIARGRALPGGDHPRLTWIEGYAEDAPLDPPYALITAAQSLHWMDWSVVLPRFRGLLTPNGLLTLPSAGAQPNPWDAAVQDVIDRHSTNRDYQPYSLVAELEQRHLFRVLGRHKTPPLPFHQPIVAYVESFHARNGFSRDRMPPDSAAAFDAAVTRLVAPYAEDGIVTLHVAGSVTWGLPAPTDD